MFTNSITNLHKPVISISNNLTPPYVKRAVTHMVHMRLDYIVFVINKCIIKTSSHSYSSRSCWQTYIYSQNQPIPETPINYSLPQCMCVSFGNIRLSTFQSRRTWTQNSDLHLNQQTPKHNSWWVSKISRVWKVCGKKFVLLTMITATTKYILLYTIYAHGRWSVILRIYYPSAGSGGRSSFYSNLLSNETRI